MKNNLEHWFIERWRIMYTIACFLLIPLEIRTFNACPELVPITAAIFVVIWFVSLQMENYTPLVLPTSVLVASSFAHPTETVVATVFIFALAIVFNFRTFVAYVYSKVMDSKNT